MSGFGSHLAGLRGDPLQTYAKCLHFQKVEYWSYGDVKTHILSSAIWTQYQSDRKTNKQ